MRGIDRSKVGLAVAAAVALSSTGALAGDGHEIHSGAVALGAHGAFTSVEGSTSGSLGIHGAYLQTVSGVTFRYGAAWEYAHVSDLDVVDLEVAFAVMRRIGESSAYPFVAVGGGLRQEWVGSFSQGRFPLGFDVGLTVLTSTSAAFGAAYEFRRILDDPVSEFNEQRVVLGLSILLRNR